MCEPQNVCVRDSASLSHTVSVTSAHSAFAREKSALLIHMCETLCGKCFFHSARTQQSTCTWEPTPFTSFWADFTWPITTAIIWAQHSLAAETVLHSVPRSAPQPWSHGSCESMCSPVAKIEHNEKNSPRCSCHSNKPFAASGKLQGCIEGWEGVCVCDCLRVRTSPAYKTWCSGENEKQKQVIDWCFAAAAAKSMSK